MHPTDLLLCSLDKTQDFGHAGRVTGRTNADSAPLPDGAVALSDALFNSYGLTPGDARLRFARRLSVIASRIWMHAWPWLFMGTVGFLALLARASLRGRLDSFVVIAVIVLPVTLIACWLVARQVVVSRDAQLCLVALPPAATELLGIPSRVDLEDGGGLIPRYPLMASNAGLHLDLRVWRGEGVSLRSRGVIVDLTASKGGLLSHCVLDRGDRQVKVRVRGRLRLK